MNTKREPGSKSIVASPQNAGWMSKYVANDTSLAGMDDYVIVPRVKVIQGTSSEELKAAFGEGTAILTPGNVLVAKYLPMEKKGEPFQFVAGFFVVEFCKWRDNKDKGGNPIVERSYDRTSTVAKRAKDAATRYEIYAGDESKPPETQKKYRYVEHLRFFGVLYGEHPLAGTRAVVSFERGEFRNGCSFVSAVKMRKQKIATDEGDVLHPIPLYMQVWQFEPAHRQTEVGKWKGLNYSIPEQPIILETEVEDMHAMHEEFKAAHAKNLLVANDDSAAEEESAATLNSSDM